MTRRLIPTLLLVSSLLLAQPAEARYVIDYGDTVSIVVKDTPQYSYNGGLRPDGIITIPYLGDIDARGLTPDQLRERVRELVSKAVRNPEVTVSVTGFRPRQITVIGEVGRPGNIDVTRPDFTVLDAIAAAGGFTPHAAAWQVVVMRGNGAATRRIPVDVEAMLRGGDMSANVRLEPGDRVQVARSPWPVWQDVLTTMQVVTTIAGVIFIAVRVSQTVGNVAR